MLAIALHVHAGFHKLFGQFVHQVILTLQVNHRACLASLINKEKRGDTGVFGHLGVISTEGWCNMHDTCTVVCGHIISGNHAEGHVLHFYEFVVADRENPLRMLFGCLFHEWSGIVIHFLTWFHPRHQLLIVHTHEVGTFILTDDTIRNHFIAGLVFHLCKLALRLQIAVNQGSRHHG